MRNSTSSYQAVSESIQRLAAQTATITEVISTRNLLNILWDKSRGQFHNVDLETIATGAQDQAMTQVIAMAQLTEAIGCVVASDTQSGSFEINQNVSSLAFSYNLIKGSAIFNCTWIYRRN